MQVCTHILFQTQAESQKTIKNIVFLKCWYVIQRRTLLRRYPEILDEILSLLYFSLRPSGYSEPLWKWNETEKSSYFDFLSIQFLILVSNLLLFLMLFWIYFILDSTWFRRKMVVSPATAPVTVLTSLVMVLFIL